MPKRANRFQRLVALLEKQLAPIGAIVTESLLVREKSDGPEREIDIAISGEIGGHKILIGIECRDHKRRADVGWIDQIIGKYGSLPVDKVVAVSSAGFTRTAREKARENNIDTFTVERALKTNWIPVTQPTKVPMTVVETRVRGVIVVTSEGQVAEGDRSKNFADIALFATDSTLFGKVIDVARATALQNQDSERLRKQIRQQVGPVAIKLTAACPEGTYFIDRHGSKREVSQLLIDAEAEFSETTLDFSTGKYRDTEFMEAATEVSKRSFSFTVLYGEKGGKVLVSVKDKSPSKKAITKKSTPKKTKRQLGTKVKKGNLLR